MTFRHSYRKNGTLKSDGLNTCFQFSEPRIGSLKSDRVNGPLRGLIMYGGNLEPRAPYDFPPTVSTREDLIDSPGYEVGMMVNK